MLGFSLGYEELPDISLPKPLVLQSHAARAKTADREARFFRRPVIDLARLLRLDKGFRSALCSETVSSVPF